MRNTILYTTTEQQIEKLRKQNLIIENEDFAKSKLELCGYSNLIKSYRDPYIVRTNTGLVYRSGVTFNQIYSLYLLDKNLRNAVMAAMQDLEEHIKESAASVIAQAFGTNNEEYLAFRNYQNRRKRNARFSLTNILNTLRKTLNTDKYPIHHYSVNYGAVPPWILFKSVYFSTIVNFIDLFKKSEQVSLSNLLYHRQDIILSDEALCKLMMDSLYICLEYRNVSAHGGRTYNHNSSSAIRYNEIFSENFTEHLFGFSQLLLVLKFFKYTKPYDYLEQILERELNRHCTQYPQDVTYLGQILNINIVPNEVVYISEHSNKYHYNPHCSGVKEAHEIQIDEAKKMNYFPCKRCAKEK